MRRILAAVGFFAIVLFVVTLHAAPPTVSSLSPTTGATTGGTQVQINGTNLTGASVTFGGAAATVLGGPPGGTILVVQTPPHAAGQVDVVVTNADGSTTVTGGFTYFVPDGPSPTVSTISPLKGTTMGGTPITITGTDFRPGATVRIGGAPAVDVVVNGAGTQITAVTAPIPGGIPGVRPVMVTNTDTTSGTKPNAYTYQSMCDADITDNCVSSLLVNGAAPPAGIIVELAHVQISITNSNNPGNRFELSPQVAPTDTITVVLEISAIDPVLAVSTGDIQNSGFRWDAAANEATIVVRPRGSSWATTGCQLPPGSCAPRANVDYTSFVLVGLNTATGAPISMLPDLQGMYMSTNAQTFSSPQYNPSTGAFGFQVGAPSRKLVDTDASDGNNGDPNDNGFFNFFISDAFITNVWGLPDPNVLVSDPTQMMVTIGGSPITPTVVDVAATATSPAGVKISFSGFHYSVESVVVVVAPTITSVSPMSGPTGGGTNITITGLNFRPGATVTIGGVPAAMVQVVNQTTITARTPPRPAGAVSIVVTNTDGTTDTLAAGFTYRPLSDIDRNGHADLVWQNRSLGYIAAWMMNGLNLMGSDLFNPPRIPDPGWRIVAATDMDQDGQLDLLWQHDVDGWVVGWKLDGLDLVASGGLSIPRVGDTNWKIVGTGDFNGDAKPDIVWHHQGSGHIAVWLMDQENVLDSRLFTQGRVADTNWRIEGVGDFNADGRPDLVWRHQSQGWVGVWLMNGLTILETRDLNPNRVPDTNWRIAAIADVNGDNRVDIIWQHVGVGWIAAWLMDGTNVTSSSSFNPYRVGDTNWRIVGPK